MASIMCSFPSSESDVSAKSVSLSEIEILQLRYSTDISSRNIASGTAESVVKKRLKVVKISPKIILFLHFWGDFF